MRRRATELRLHEELLLLALRDDRGTLESRAGMYRHALAGALLAELLLARRISIGETKRKLVDLVDSAPLRDPLLTEALDLIASAKRRRAAATWVGKLAGMKRLRHRIAERLCRRGILRESEGRVLLIFSRKVYPTVDPGPERHLVERLREAVYSDTEVREPRTAILVALAHGTGLLAAHFPRKELRGRKRRLEAITSGDIVGEAAREAVRAAQAAVIAAATAATVATTAGS